MNRTHLWLGLALVAQLVLLGLLRAPLAGDHDAAARPFLPGLAGLDATRIELVGEDGARLELLRSDGGWTLSEVDGFPADAGKIETLLDDLRSLEVRRPLVRNARYHDTFRVADDDFVGRLRIWSDAAEPAIDLVLGSASNYRATHARLAGDDAVYEVEGLAPFDLSPRRETWIRKQLVDVSPDEVINLRIANDAGTLSIDRGENGWTVEGDRLEADPAAVDALLAAATGLRIVGSAGAIDAAAQGLDHPAAEVELRLREGRSVRLTIGDAVPDDDGMRYASVEGLEFAVTLRESAVRSLLDTQRDGVLRPIGVGDEPSAPSAEDAD